MESPPSDPASGSVTGWIDALKLGDDAAASSLWKRYFDELVRLAHGRLRSISRAANDEEDVALERLPQPLRRGDGRPIRAARRSRRPLAPARHDHRCARRMDSSGTIGARSAAGDASAPKPIWREDGRGDILATTAGPAGPPDVIALMAEEYRLLMARLGDDTLVQVALMRMEGYTGDEIAERLGCNRRTVSRKLDLIRRRWMGSESEATR